MPKKRNKTPVYTLNVPPLAVPIQTYDILLGDNIKVIEDKKSKARIANFPFEFPDGVRGVVILCRIEDEPWVPNKTISKVTIEFHG